MMEKIIGYKCEFCGRILLSRSGSYTHSKNCYSDPANRACVTCKHIEVSERGGHQECHVVGITCFKEKLLNCCKHEAK